MGYPDLFKRAALLWWRTRLLWPLGILAAFMGAGDYATGNFNASSNFSVPADGDFAGETPAWIAALAESELIQAIAANPVPFALGLGLILLLWTIIATLLGQLAHGAMIRVADVADQGYRPSLGDGMRVAAARLLPLFLLSLLVALPVLVILAGVIAAMIVVISQLVLAIGSEAFDTPGGGIAALGGLLLCIIPLVLIMSLAGLVLGFFARLAQRACVIEGRGPIASLVRAWQLVRRSFGLALLNWVAVLVLTSLFGVIVTLPAIAVALPVFFSAAQSGTLPWGLLVGLLVYGFLVTVPLGGVLTSFNSALWTVVYRALVEREQAAAASFTPAVSGS